jgi:hypothetical protein
MSDQSSSNSSNERKASVILLVSPFFSSDFFQLSPEAERLLEEMKLQQAAYFEALKSDQKDNAKYVNALETAYTDAKKLYEQQLVEDRKLASTSSSSSAPSSSTPSNNTGKSSLSACFHLFAHSVVCVVFCLVLSLRAFCCADFAFCLFPSVCAFLCCLCCLRVLMSCSVADFPVCAFLIRFSLLF